MTMITKHYRFSVDLGLRSGPGNQIIFSGTTCSDGSDFIQTLFNECKQLGIDAVIKQDGYTILDTINPPPPPPQPGQMSVASLRSGTIGRMDVSLTCKDSDFVMLKLSMVFPPELTYW